MAEICAELDVWGKAMELVEEVYRFTSVLPCDHEQGVVQQMRSAAVNVASHVACGQKRPNVIELCRCLGTARGFLQDIETQMMIAGMSGFGAVERAETVKRRVDEVEHLIAGLLGALQSSASPAVVQNTP